MFWRAAMRPPLLLLWLTEQQKASHTSRTSLCWKLYQNPTQQLPVQTAQLICKDCNSMCIGAQKAVSDNLLLHPPFSSSVWTHHLKKHTKEWNKVWIGREVLPKSTRWEFLHKKCEATHDTKRAWIPLEISSLHRGTIRRNLHLIMFYCSSHQLALHQHG